jgi:hypothetical protein
MVVVGVGGDDSEAGLGEGLDAEVAAGAGPFVVLFGGHGGDDSGGELGYN